MKRTAIRRKRPTLRRGKVTGRIRLSGKPLAELRRACWERDHGWCHDCGEGTYYAARFDGDPHAYDMAHIVSRGAGGSDTLENVRTLCHACHMAEHREGRK